MSVGETVAAVLATGAGIAAIVIDRASDDAAGEAPILAGLAGAVTIGFAVLLFAWVLPRAKLRKSEGTANAALATSVIGCFSVASAWTGLPFVLGTGGAMLGTVVRRGTEEPRQREIAAFAVGIGVLAVALGCAAIGVL